MRRQLLPPAGGVERAAVGARDAVEHLGMDAGGRGEHRHVAGERLEHGETEALPLRGHEHGVDRVDVVRDLVGVDATHRQQRHLAGDRLGVGEALDRARRVMGNRR